MAYKKITAEDLLNKGVIGLPDTPELSTSEMQAKFEEVVRQVVVPAFNNLVDSLEKDKKTTDTALANAMAKPVLLWENPQPEAVFENQLVPLDLSGYSRITIDFRKNTEDGYEMHAQAKLASQGAMQWAKVNKVCERGFGTSVNGVDFYRGHKWDIPSGTENGDEINTTCIPLRIYGIV